MKLTLKQKQIIIGVLVVLVVVVAVVLGVILTKKSTTTIKPSTSKPVATKSLKTTLLPVQPFNNLVQVGFKVPLERNCYKIKKTRQLPMKNIILNSILTSSRYPEILFNWSDIKIRASVKALIIDTNDFSKSKYILTFPFQNELNELADKNYWDEKQKIIVPNVGKNYICEVKIILYPKSIEYINQNGIKVNNMSCQVELKELVKINIDIIKKYLEVCIDDKGSTNSNIAADIVMPVINIEYPTDILDTIKNDLL